MLGRLSRAEIDLRCHAAQDHGGMSDDEDWYKPNRPPVPPRQPTPGESVWSLRKNGKQVDCELRFHGESYGWECQSLHEGELAYGQRFVMREGAVAEAEAQRQRLIDEGWAVPAVTVHLVRPHLCVFPKDEKPKPARTRTRERDRC
jgi:hypothetical protein